MINLSNGRNRKTGRGFTLIEILIVVAIIGVITTILIPNLLDAVHKAKQRRTLMDIRSLGTGWFSWLTDEMSAAAAGSTSFDFNTKMDTPLSAEELLAILFDKDGVPYVSIVPSKDGWGHDFDYRWAGDLLQPEIIGIRSFGRDGIEGPATNPYPYGPFSVTDYDQDIVWVDGVFVRFPQGAMVR